MSTDLPQHLHSAAYFGDQRDYWWHADFVALCVARLGIGQVERVLDAGCGVGHWGRVLLPHLPAAHLTGVDREPRWVQEATDRAGDFAPRCAYQVADVAVLPFADASFDLVTAQTVLIHVADPAAVLAEWLRVLRPGGTLLLAEPNNLSGTMSVGAPRHGEPIERRLDLVRLHMAVERGKRALGEGDNSIADLLPGLLRAAGLDAIRCWLDDRAPMVVPPYASIDQQLMIQDFLDMDERGWWGWSRADVERYYVASGQPAGDFEHLWRTARAAVAQDAAAMRAGQFSAAWGGLHYLFAATKPG
ncbi:MAG: class I SAM-dependent methyltransferase [Deltaproteobacteria bacterium]|nr:class I SAM-dependent methyltransferase [Deltaproteobacteria bacterium]